MSENQAFLDTARKLLGERGLATDPEIVAPWLTDWRGRYTGKAIGMASPASTAEVAALVEQCAEYGIAIVPQGGNSGMSGGATPDESGNTIVLSLRRMKAIRHLSAEDKLITCDAGMVLQDLHEAVEHHGLRFPLTLGGKGSATVGGLISTNAGGTQVLRHGTMRAQVAGLEVVLPDGRVLDTLTPLKKDNRGFDLKQLFIGSEGTMGIVTGATLFLADGIADRAVVWIGLDRIEDARELLLLCQELRGDNLEGFEVIPDRCLDAVLDYLPDARSPLSSEQSWHALIELVARQGEQDCLQRWVEDIFQAGLDHELIQDAVIAANEKQAEQFWLLRDSISPAERAIGPAMQHDISVPVEDMADFVAKAVPMVEQQFSGTQAVAFGHLGDGNVHFHVLAPKNAIPGEWEEKQGKEISRFVHNLVTEWRGSISAEHGIGQMKRAELGRLGDPVSLALMRSMKDALDPNKTLNPGKLIPDANSK